MTQQLDEPVTARTQSDNAVAFGQGADARLAGLPLVACPYQTAGDGNYDLARTWRAGWCHANDFFGVDAKWYVRPLPAIGEVL